MPFNKKPIPLALVALPLLMGLAIPSSGDFTTRKESIWSKDIINNALNSYTQTMCALNKLHPELNVGGEAYLSKVNYTACAPGTVASPSDDWYIYKVKSVAEADGYTAHIWLVAKEKNDVKTNVSNVVYQKLHVPSSANGDFTLESCAASNEAPDTNCIRKNYIQKIGNELHVHSNSDTDPTQGSYGRYLHLIATLGDTTGFGSLKSSGISANNSSVSGKFQVDMDFDYAYEGNDAVLNIIKYKQGDPTQTLSSVYPAGTRCITRSKTNSKISVFNYEVFNADGSQYIIDKPQIPYRIIDANNNFLVDSSGNQISGRIMWDQQNNRQGWYLSVDKSVVVSRLVAGQNLRAQTWLGGNPNYNLDIRLNPADASDFQILDQEGNPYQESPALGLMLTINNGVNIDNLLDPSLNGTTQALSYMGNGYIWGLPWDKVNGFGYYIKNAAQATGINDGKAYFIRPMFYSIEPTSIACPSNAEVLLGNTSSSRSALPSNLSFTGTVWPAWSDPRTTLGAPPETGANFKYVDGVNQ